MSVNQVPACPIGNPYVIRPGDTLFALAARFNTTVAAILTANPGINPNSLQIGQIICIPGAPSPISCPGGVVYQIQAGDTLFRIAQRFGIPLQTLIAANPGIDPGRLQIGQSICIPGVAPTVPAPCCRILSPLQPFPPTQVPFPPAGSALIQPAGPVDTAVTIALSGMPDPGIFGQFDAYQARVIFPPPVAPETIPIDLAPARAFEAPTVWAGSRVIPRLLTGNTTVAIIPLNIATGAVGSPLLQGTVPPCL